jgi:hypothetical protein
MLLVLRGGCHLFFKKLGEHLFLLLVRVHVRPPRQMDEHLPGVSTRRDGRSCPTSEYRQTARTAHRTSEYRLVGGGTAECRQPAGGLAKGGGVGDRATRGGGGGFATRKWGSLVLSSTERARPCFSLVRSPRAHPGGGGRGWPGLSGWMNVQIWGKTRNRERGWTE